METEKQVEAYLKKRVEELGGICYKFVSPGRAAVPDRICVFMNQIEFVECKGEAGKLSSKQRREFERLHDLGAQVYVIHSKDSVDDLLKYLRWKHVNL